jgi:hypothetical protein
MVTDAIHNLLRHFRNIKRRLTLFEEQNMSTQQHSLQYWLDYNMRSFTPSTSIMAGWTLYLLS